MKETCEYKTRCKETKCPLYKKTCVLYCQSLVKEVVKSITQTKVNITSSQIEEAKSIENPSSYYTTSLSKALCSLIKELQRDIRKVKVYNYTTAIDASINDEIPQEQLVFIDSSTKFKEADKGRQTIESLVRKLAESNKTVVVRVQTGYPLPEGQELL